MRLASICVALCPVVATAQDIPVLEAYQSDEIVELNIRVDALKRSTGSVVVWRDGISIADAEFIRLHVKTEGPKMPEGSRLMLFGELGQEFEFDLSKISTEGSWTRLLPKGRVDMALVSEAPIDDDTVLVIDQLLKPITGLTLYSTHGPNQLVKIFDPSVPENVRALAGPVALLSFVDSGVPRSCTGFLIAPDVLLTNQHCIQNDETCRTMNAAFGYHLTETLSTQIGAQVGCSGYEAFHSNFDLDATAVRLNMEPGAQYGVIAVPDMPVDPVGPLFIIQHPGNVPKSVSLLDCAAGDIGVDGRAQGVDFTHTCDTAGGSSGAPVLNEAGALVGLHHFGFEDSPESNWTENRAVLAGPIATWLIKTEEPVESEGPISDH